MTSEQTALAMACLALGFCLGMIGGLRIGIAFMERLGQRIEQLERDATRPEVMH